MAQRRLVLALAALLTIAALGFVATAIDDGTTSGDGPGTDGIEGSTGGAGGQQGSQTVAAVLVVILLALAVGGIGVATYRDSLPRWLVVVLLVSVVVLVLLIAVGHVLDPAEPSNQTNRDAAAPDTPDEASTPSNTEPAAGGEPGPLSTTETLLLLGMLLVSGAFVITRFSRGVPEDPPAEETDDSTAVAEAAGRAADELDETTLSNAVFRAWQEMTDALDVENPETTTPAEFEDIAVEAGLDRDDVATLTDLFREVRYGETPATEEHEERARAALRHIEDAYADEASDEGGVQQ